jgi:hypothetical protein
MWIHLSTFKKAVNDSYSNPHIILVIFLMSSKRFVAARWSLKMLQRIYLTGSRSALSHNARLSHKPLYRSQDQTGDGLHPSASLLWSIRHAWATEGAQASPRDKWSQGQFGRALHSRPSSPQEQLAGLWVVWATHCFRFCRPQPMLDRTPSGTPFPGALPASGRGP